VIPYSVLAVFRSEGKYFVSMHGHCFKSLDCYGYTCQKSSLVISHNLLSGMESQPAEQLQVMMMSAEDKLFILKQTLSFSVYAIIIHNHHTS